MWWEQLWEIEIPTAEKIVRTVLVYVAIVFLLRIAGKRGLAQLNSLDLAVILLLSNVVQNAIIGPDSSLIGGIIGAVVLVGVNSILVHSGAWLAERHPRIAQWLAGSPTTLVKNGEFDVTALKREGLRRSEVVFAARQQNADHISDIKQMVIEPAGHLVVTLKPEEESANAGDVATLRRELTEIRTTLHQISAKLDA